MSVVAELAQPVKLIPQWHGHGAILVMVDGTFVYLRADDVERLAAIPAWEPGEALLADDWPTIADGTPFYRLEHALTRCDQAGTALAVEFATWLRTELDRYLAPDVLDQAKREPSFLDAYTVQRAARILSTETGVELGRQRLFAHMCELGWIERTPAGTDDWRITLPTRRDGLLTYRASIVRGRTYQQIHITEEGLHQLRTSWAAHAHQARGVAPVLPLFT